MSENSEVVQAVKNALVNAEDNAYRFKLSGKPSPEWEEKVKKLRVALDEAERVFGA